MSIARRRPAQNWADLRAAVLAREVEQKATGGVIDQGGLKAASQVCTLLPETLERILSAYEAGRAA